MSSNKEKIELKRISLKAVLGKVLIKFTRPFEKGSVTGYVLDVGPEFLLLAIVSDEIRFDGFGCFRVQDVRRLKFLRKSAKFPVEALKKRGLQTPKKPKVDLSNVTTLLETAGHAYPVVTIFRERVNPDVCYIGHVVKVGKKRVSLLEIGPDAEWDQEETEYNTSPFCLWV